MKRYLIALFVAGIALAHVPASAHHSVSAHYLPGSLVTIQGEVVQFSFRNPHSFVYVMVTEKDGTRVRYAVEWGSIRQLAGRINKATLKPGDHIVVTGFPGRNPNDHRMRLINVRRPKDGFAWGHRSGDVLG